MKKVFFVFLLSTTIPLTACTKSIRYSNDEIKDFPISIQERIKNEEISVGMTKLQVRYAWGGPHTVNVLPPGEGGKERVEWIYIRYKIFKTRLIFTDNILTEIISSEPGLIK